MHKRALGNSGLEVSALGLGCMGMSAFYGPTDEAESLATLDRALDLGIDFFDTADMYGPHKNEELLGKWFKNTGKRDKVVLATKFGIVIEGNSRSISGKPAYVRSACEASLKRLGVDVIDLYYLHRIDPNTPIEDTIGAMAGLVKEGKVRHIGVSEAKADTLRRAAKVHPIAALQTEYSLWSRDPEDELLAVCKELGTAFVAYSPLGRGFLTGEIKRFEDLAQDDFRRMNPRFQGENFDKNMKLVEHVKEMATERTCTPAQLALAWVLSQDRNIIPIPGTKKRSRLEENAAAADMELNAEELARLDTIAPRGAFAGERYAPAGMTSVNL